MSFLAETPLTTRHVLSKEEKSFTDIFVSSVFLKCTVVIQLFILSDIVHRPVF
jgi:hypothetical protein